MRHVVLSTAVLLALALPAAAQRVQVDNLPSHVIVDSCSGCGGGASAPTASSGTLTNPTESIDISTAGAGTVGIAISGSWTGTLWFRGKIAGSAIWFLPGTVKDRMGTVTGGLITQTTVNGEFTFDATGYSDFQVYANALSSGSASVSLTSTNQTSWQTSIQISGSTGNPASVVSGALTVADTSADASLTSLAVAVNTIGVDNSTGLTVQGSPSGVPVPITCTSGCGSPPASADGTAFTAGATNVSPIAALVDDVATTTVAEDAYGAPRMSTTRVLYTDLSQTGANATAIKVDGSAVTQPVGGTVAATQSGTWTVQPGNTANSTAWKVDGSAVTQPVSAVSLPLPTGAATDATMTNGTLIAKPYSFLTSHAFTTTGENFDVDVSRVSAVEVKWTGGFVAAGIISFFSYNGSVAVAIPAVRFASNAMTSVTAINCAVDSSGANVYFLDVAGVQTLRLSTTGVWSSASVTVTVGGITGGTRGLFVGQGAPVATASAWPTKVTDGTSIATVKAASTAPAAGDPALVVGLSPNGNQAIAATQTDRTQKAQITDGTRDGTVKAASTLPVATDTAVVVTTRDTVTVSGTVTTTPPGNASTNVAQLAGTATSVNSGLKDAGTLRVVLATDQPALTNKLLVTPDSVALPANQSVNVAQFGANAVATGTGASGVGVPRVTVANDSNVLVTPPTVTKATQGSTGFTVQNLKDAGRTTVMITATVASTATAETLITLTRSVGLAATGTCSSCGITTGKRLRIQAIALSARNSTGTTASNVTVNFRAAVGGSTTASSPLQMHWVVALPASTVSTLFSPVQIPDGFEIDANGATNTYGMTITHPQFSAGTVVATFDITLIGYEY